MEQPQINMDMVRLARESRGLSQTDLSKLIGLTPSGVSRLENGTAKPTQETITSLAKSLSYTKEFFYQTDTLFGTGCSFLFHRQRRTMPVPEQRRVIAIVNVLRIQIDRLIRDIEFDSQNSFMPMDIDQYKGPCGVASILRSFWKIPPGPISNMIKILESAGGIVTEVAFGNRQIDAISLWVPNMPPLFFVNTATPGDRQRFTLAHELGHIIMHSIPDEQIEDEANAFASEFLMPSEEIGNSLNGLTLEKAFGLKAHWRVSIQAIIRRAKDLKKISSAQYTSLWKRINMAGMKIREPFPIDKEKATLLSDIFEVHSRLHGYSIEDLSRFAMISKDEFIHQFAPNRSIPLRIVR